MTKPKYLQIAKEKKIYIECFSALTTEIISKVINMMSDEEINYWTKVQKVDKLISKVIIQFCPKDKLDNVIDNSKLENENFCCFRDEFLIKLVKIDLNEGLKKEFNIIL